MANKLSIPGYPQWLAELKEKIRSSQLKAALKVNAEMLSLYWEMGIAITAKQADSDWGDKIITQLSKDLTSEFPEIKGFSPTNLKYIRRWYQFYSSIGQQAVDQLEALEKTVQESGQQPVDQIEQATTQPFPGALSIIPWSHHIQIFTKAATIEEALYYIQQTAANNWSRNYLVHQIESALYKRKGKAFTNFELTLPKAQSDLANETLKNPYNLDFLSLGLQSNERDLEKALIENIKKFLLELGAGFSFVNQQYYIKVGEKEFYIDLLFYHTRLHCYVVVELKVTEFDPEFASKLGFYLTAIDEQVKMDIDAPTIGLLLCKSADKIVVEYSLRNMLKPMSVAEYRYSALPEELQAELPTEEELKEQLNIEITIPQSPLLERINRLKELIANTGREEVKKERDRDDTRYLFNELLPALMDEIKQNLSLIIPEFSKTEIGRRINGIINYYYTTADLEAELEKGNVYLLGLNLQMDGFKKGGTKTFNVSKEVVLSLHRFTYEIGIEQHKSWMEKLYHEKWNKQEIKEFAERWCEELIEEITDRIERL